MFCLVQNFGFAAPFLYSCNACYAIEVACVDCGAMD